LPAVAAASVCPGSFLPGPEQERDCNLAPKNFDQRVFGLEHALGTKLIGSYKAC